MYQDKYFLIGLIFLIIEILIIVRNINAKKYEEFLWLCEIGVIITMIGFLFNNIQIIKAIINVGFVTQIISMVALFLNLTTKFETDAYLGIKNMGKYYILTSILLHLTLLSAFIITFNEKSKIISLFYSLLIIVFVYLTSKYFTSKEKNINFVHYFPGINISSRYYSTLWFLAMIFIVVLPSYYVFNLL